LNDINHERCTGDVINDIREISVLRAQKILERERNHGRRGGLLYLGALRELFVITFAVGLVMTSLWQASSLLDAHLSTQKSDSLDSDAWPVMNLAVDQEHLTLFTHAMTGKRSQISLETGTLTSRPVPKNVVAVAMSAKACTNAMLEEWAEDRRVHHRVNVIRNDQIVISEEMNFEEYSEVSVLISSDGNVVMCFSCQGAAIGWDLTESVPCRWTIDVGPINHRNWLSPDGRRLFVSSRKGPSFICDAKTGEARMSLDQIKGNCSCVSWSADGNRLSIGDLGGGVHVIDALTGQRIWHNKLDVEFARSVAFSDDGDKLAIGGFDEFIRVCDLSRPDQQPIQLKGQSGVIRSLVFTASNENLISGSFNGTIFEWSLANQTCVRKFQ
jgi:WD40 repeat protein